MTGLAARGPWPKLTVADGCSRGSLVHRARTPLSLVVCPGSEAMLWFGRILTHRFAMSAVTLLGTKRGA